MLSAKLRQGIFLLACFLEPTLSTNSWYRKLAAWFDKLTMPSSVRIFL